MAEGSLPPVDGFLELLASPAGDFPDVDWPDSSFEAAAWLSGLKIGLDRILTGGGVSFAISARMAEALVALAVCHVREVMALGSVDGGREAEKWLLRWSGGGLSKREEETFALMAGVVTMFERAGRRYNPSEIAAGEASALSSSVAPAACGPGGSGGL